ncbi:MAG TPA: hypothetical protein VEQ42_03300 [Pyrinomonadaceae bacterium]|nr:hypothetical protein [Pyrinomonadaceae bacterium]
MKYLLLILLLAALVALVYWRLRPYVRAARRALKVVGEMRRVARGETSFNVSRGRERERERAAATPERLVRCASCGAWTPASRAVKLRDGVADCSHACLERAAEQRR